MKRKLLVLLMIVLMVTAMMPTAVFADGESTGQEEKLYAIWLPENPTEDPDDAEASQSEAYPKDQVKDWTDRLDIERGYSRQVSCFGYLQKKDEIEQFVVLNEPPQSEKLTFETEKDGAWRITADADSGDTGTIRIEQDGVTYVMDYELRLPGIGAYKKPELNAGELLLGSTFSYDDLGSETDGKKTIYFVANTIDQVTDMELSGDFSKENIESEFHPATTDENGVQTAPAYLEVHVSKQILSEEFEVLAKINEGKWNYWFRITGNILYRIDFENDPESGFEAGKIVKPDGWDNQIRISPLGSQYSYFGIPTGTQGEFRIAGISGCDEELICTKNEETAAYGISAGESAVIGKTYYIYAEYEGKEYKIPVYYGLPGIGAYTQAALSESNLISSRDIAFDALTEENGSKVIYFIVDTSDNVEKMWIPENSYSTDILSSVEFHSATEETENSEATPAYLRVEVSKEVLSEEFEVRAQVSGDDWSNEWNEYFRITGNLLYCIASDANSNLQIDDQIETDRWDREIFLIPGEENPVFLGVPTENTNVYQIMEAESAAPELTLTRSSRNGSYLLQANDSAEIGKTYFLQATVNGKTYRIPVHYDFPTIGVYRDPKISEESYLGTRNLYSKVKDTKTFYIISSDSKAELSIEECPDGLELTAGRTSQEEGNLPYYKAEITDAFQEGEFWIIARNDEEYGEDGMSFWLSKEVGEDGDEAYKPADTSLLICTKVNGEYEPIPLKTSGYGGQEEAAQFYVDEHPDRTFYVLLDEDSPLSAKEPLSLLKLDNYRESTDVVEKGVSVTRLTGTDATSVYGGKTYHVWEITVEDDFTGASRVGFNFDGDFAAYCIDAKFDARTKFMWILDESYEEPTFDSGNDGNIIACENVPTGDAYQNLDELLEDVDALGVREDMWGTKCLNLSKPLTDEANAIYLVHPAETVLHDKSAIVNGYEVEGSGIGRTDHFGGWFQQKQSGDIYTYTPTGKSITVDGRTMQITKACLKETYGHKDIDTVFYLTKENDVKVQGYATAYLQKGMDLVIKGADEDVVTIDSEYNIVREAVGNTPWETLVQFVKDGDSYRAFYRDACTQVSDEGTGRFIGFNVVLKPGYVIEKITDANGSPLAFTSERAFFYSPLDEDGNEIYSEEEIAALGWRNGISGAGGEYAGRHVIGTYHCVASSMQEYMQGFHRAEVGNESISDFVKFLLEENTTGGKLTAKMKAAYTNYTVYFDPASDNVQNEIVFHVAKAEIGDEVAAMNDKEIKCQLKQLADSGAVTNLKNSLEALGYGDYDVLKVYEISAEESDDSLYNITIPESELKEGTDLSDYYVVYYKDGEEIPYVMETTYVEGKGIVFTTGHFSNYAIIYKPKADPDPTPTPTPGGGAIAPIPSDVTTSGTADDKVTTAKTDVKTSEKTNADGTKETVAEVKVSAANQKEIIKQAKQNGSKEIVLEVPASAAGNATSANVQLEKAFLDQLTKETNASLTIRTPFGDTTYTQDELKALLEKADGDTVTLAVSKADPAAEEAERIAQAKAAAKQMSMKARSTKTSKGIKVVFKTDAESKAFIESMKELGYTVKYRFYRSTKKASGYKAMLTKDKPVYLNTNGKKGVKYYYKVQVRVYDENGKLITATALKQCRYACRTWTK